MSDFIDEDALEKEITDGLVYYGKISEKRAKELAWLNNAFVANELYERLEEVLKDISDMEVARVKGIANGS